MSDTDDDWTGPERDRLHALARDAAPSAQLEPRVVEALRVRGLIAPRRRRAWITATAAGVAGLVLGAVAGRATVAPSGRPSVPEGRSFALLLHPGAGLDPAESAARARVIEYGTWARGLAADGRLLTGQKLKDPVRMLRPAGAVTAGQSDPEGRLLGFFLVRARTMEEAEDIARSCPHLRHGGTIALREIDPT
jgi:hypothetical protein